MSESVVYFIGADEGPIKIGTTAGSLEARLSSIQTGNPTKIRVLAVVPGGEVVEAAFHAAFAKHRVAGEWFARSPDLMNLVEANALARHLSQDKQKVFHRALRNGAVLVHKAARGQYLGGETISAKRPWEALKISRRTWYRRSRRRLGLAFEVST